MYLQIHTNGVDRALASLKVFYIKTVVHYMFMYESTFPGIVLLFSSGRGYFLALSAVGHAVGPLVHGASVGPGRAPWCVLWAFKVGKPGK